MINLNQRPMPPLSLLDRSFHYDPATGRLTWREATSRVRAGDEAGWTDARHQYRRVKFAGQSIAVHRIGWSMFHRTTPEPVYIVDHINGDRQDNRIINLRLLTPAQNSINRKGTAKRALPKGVSRQGRKFMARLNVRGHEARCGIFYSVREAALAYDETASRALGVHVRTNESLGLVPAADLAWERARHEVADWDECNRSFDDLIELLADAYRRNA